jgi:FlaA1/EpsC-like NDP-sugar epimerase
MRMVDVNVLNTISTIESAKAFGAKKYFCVSTDKAANPVNMMGASKRIMEMFLMRASESLPISTARSPMWRSQMAACCTVSTSVLPSVSRSLPPRMCVVTL